MLGTCIIHAYGIPILITLFDSRDMSGSFQLDMYIRARLYIVNNYACHWVGVISSACATYWLFSSIIISETCITEPCIERIQCL